MVKSIVFVIVMGLLTWAIYHHLHNKPQVRTTEPQINQNDKSGTFVEKSAEPMVDTRGESKPLKNKSVSTLTNKYTQPSMPPHQPKKIKNIRSKEEGQRVPFKASSSNIEQSSSPSGTSLSQMQNPDLKADPSAISAEPPISIPHSEKMDSYMPPKTEVYVSGGAFYHRADGTDRNNNSKALLLSEISFYADVGLKIHLFTDPLWYLRTQISLSDYRYKKDVTVDVISDQNVFAPGFHMGLGKLFWNWFAPELFAGVDREFFYFSPVLNRIEFDSDWISKVGVSTESKWALRNRIGFGFNTLFAYMRFGDTLEDGYEISGGPMLSYKSASLNFDFQFDHKKTPTLDLDTLQVRSYIRYYF